MGKKVKERVISEAGYLVRLEQGVPVGDCRVDMGNGELVYALYEVAVTGVPISKYGDRTFLLHDVCAIAVADNTRVDTRQRDMKIREVENAIEYDRKRKEVKENIKRIVSDYYAGAKRKVFGFSQECIAKQKKLEADETFLMSAIEHDEPLPTGTFPLDLCLQHTQLINEFLEHRSIVVKRYDSSYEKNYNPSYKRNINNDSGTPWTFFVGLGATAASEIYFSKDFGTWMGRKFKIYNQEWGGNQYTGGKKKFAKGISNKFSIAGKITGLGGMIIIFKDYKTEKIDGYQFIMEEASSAYSTFGGLYGAAWSVGWEAGRYVTQQIWYQKVKFQFFYNWWQRQYGVPSYGNRHIWVYFFENYQP
jgi:hypothetical protein